MHTALLLSLTVQTKNQHMRELISTQKASHKHDNKDPSFLR